MGRRRDGSVEQVWRARLVRYRRSDVTVAAFCRAEGVSTASFYAWRQRLQGTDAGRRRENGGLGQPLFVPVSVKPAAAEVRIELPGGAVVRLPHDADEQLLRTCLRGD